MLPGFERFAALTVAPTKEALAAYFKCTTPPCEPPAPLLLETRPLVVVITGATAGLGLAFAKAFRELGHTVIGCGRREDRLAALRAEFGAPHTFFACDVCSEESVASFASALGNRDIDIVIANAGVGQRDLVPVWELATAAFVRPLEVNTAGTFYVTRHFGRILAEQAKRPGAPLKRLINMSSGLAHCTNHLQAGYIASKWAVEALSKATAQSIRAYGLTGRMICVPLAPGNIASELNVSPGARPIEGWGLAAANYILSLNAEHSGASLSLTSQGYYDAKYVKTWVIPDGMPLPPAVVEPQPPAELPDLQYD